MKLKRCPFCGSPQLEMSGTSVCWVSCSNCQAEAPPKSTKEEAVKAWNRRKKGVTMEHANARFINQ